MEGSLFRRILGDSFHELSSGMKAYHGSEKNKISIRSSFHVSRSDNVVVNQILDILGFPKEGIVPISIKILKIDNKEMWKRKIGSWQFTTSMSVCDDIMVETAGPFKFGFKLVVKDGVLYFKHLYTKFLFMTLPDTLAIRIRSFEAPVKNGFKIHVRLDSPVVGKLLSYTGVLNL